MSQEVRSSAVRDTSLLTTASLINGAAAYVFAVVAARFLGPEGFSRVSVLWSFWAVSVALFGFPLQHWVTRILVVRQGRALMRQDALKVLGLAVAQSGGLTVISLFSEFFAGEIVWSYMVGIITLGVATIGVVRGVLAASGRYATLAVVIAVENAIRVIALFIVLSIDGSAEMVGWAVVVGALTTLLFVPGTFGTLLKKDPDSDNSPNSIFELLTFSGASGLAQATLQVAPAMAAVLGQTDLRISAAFATFALARAPVLVIAGLSGAITPTLVRYLLAERHVELARWTNRLAVGGGLVSVVMAVAAYSVGTTIVELIFGPGLAYTPFETSLVAAGGVLAVVNLIFLLVVVAGDLTVKAFRVWTTSTVSGLVTVVVTVGDGYAIALGFLVVELMAFALGYREVRRSLLAPGVEDGGSRVRNETTP